MYKILFEILLKLVLLVANIIVIIKCQIIKHTDGDILDIYSSTFQMQSLLKAEIKLVNHLKNYTVENFDDDKETKHIIDNVISKHYQNFDPGPDLENYISHPFNAFGVISRTAELKDLPMLLKNVPQM